MQILVTNFHKLRTSQSTATTEVIVLDELSLWFMLLVLLSGFVGLSSVVTFGFVRFSVSNLIWFCTWMFWTERRSIKMQAMAMTDCQAQCLQASN